MSVHNEQALRDAAYFIWEREGRPEGRAEDHWERAARELAAAPEASEPESSELESGEPESGSMSGLLDEEEKAVDGRPDVDFPALLTKDVPGG